ncbi:Zinc finger, C2H2-like domain-containing protein [Strongyloides ratti]|uniref:Zinc finger, C2H2-like domain-containing protein n=1 Tax=Strongyloides ratti TaxID=34506 RepID=A0A090LBU6_STRRB|nr:Zinc finger, C2H2-like domain-containing protein [Strongyloides ratti]CEF67236.1 Zinc finger, C2H2-like domain-containing protein [Strongyloides ratti]
MVYACLFCGKVVKTLLLKSHIESHITYPLYRCGECKFECYKDTEFLDHISETYHLSSQLKNAYVQLFVDRLEKITHYAHMDKLNFKNQSFKILRDSKNDKKCTILSIRTFISCLFCKEKLKCTDVTKHILLHLNFLEINNNFTNEVDSDDIYKKLNENVLVKCISKMIEDDFLYAAKFGLNVLLENSGKIYYFSIPIKVSIENNLSI